MKLEGFGIFVDDMSTMIRFYRDVLGFEIKEDEDASNVFLVKDGILFLLYRKSDFEQMTGTGHWQETQTTLRLQDIFLVFSMYPFSALIDIM